MRHWHEWSAITATLTILVATQARTDQQQAVVVWEGAAAVGGTATLVRALDLLPSRPSRVAVIDASRARSDVREMLLRLDAFVVRDSAVVYVVRQSALLRGAISGSSMHLHALAAAIWHELAHLRGADEREARSREQALWLTFIRDQRVDPVDGLRYLSALEGRPNSPPHARAEPAR